jgi:hypothetical protein
VNKNVTSTLSANESFEKSSAYSDPISTDLPTRHSKEIKSYKNEGIKKDCHIVNC